MAKLNMGILGGFSGKVGTVVGYIRKGQPVIRALPQKSQSEATDGQKQARMRFGALRKMVPAFVPAFNIGFRAQLDEKMVHCVAFSELWKLGVVGEAPECKIDFSKVIVSKGRRPNLAAAEVSRKGKGKIVATWAPKGNIPPADGTDEVRVVIFSEDETYVRVSEPVERSKGRMEMAVPRGRVHCWLMVAAVSEKETSTSQYFCID